MKDFPGVAKVSPGHILLFLFSQQGAFHLYDDNNIKCLLFPAESTMKKFSLLGPHPTGCMPVTCQYSLSEPILLFPPLSIRLSSFQEECLSNRPTLETIFGQCGNPY